MPTDTVGRLDCCSHGGCWASRCQIVGDGKESDTKDLCRHPVQVSPELRIPQCMAMITPRHIVEAVESYYGGGALTHG